MEREREREQWIDAIGALPEQARQAVEGLTEAQLAESYRPGGWTVRQVIHHLADSHANGSQRLRLALTEHRPVLRHYDQDAWAALADACEGPLDESLGLLQATHARMVRLIAAQPPEAFARTALHPEVGELSLDDLLRTYAEHGAHHLDQVRGLRAERGW